MVSICSANLLRYAFRSFRTFKKEILVIPRCPYFAGRELIRFKEIGMGRQLQIALREVNNFDVSCCWIPPALKSDCTLTLFM